MFTARSRRSPLTRTLTATTAFALLTTATAGAALADRPASPSLDAEDGTAAETLAEGETYRGEIEVVRTPGFSHEVNEDGEEVLEGTVFIDRNQNSRQDRNERGLRGVTVSNGRDVVTTDRQGRYSIPAFENATFFITQPSGFQVPLDADNVPQFHYNHLPAGSPELEFGGIDPTGPLPSAINFPVMRSQATAAEEQKCAMAGDLQTYDLTEVGYARDGAMKDLAAREDVTACGVLFLGDIVGDDLDLFAQVRDLTSTLDVPARFLPGNHDLDFDAETADHSFDTYRATLAPEYYSYDVGDMHVVALNTVRYPCTPDVDNADGNHDFCDDPAGDPRYNGHVDEQQMAWLEADLAQVPEDKLIVLASHIGLVNVNDQTSWTHQTDQVNEIHDLVGDRPAIAFSGHSHTAENMLEGDSYAGWQNLFGIDGLPFQHVTAGAISGDWYSGALTPEGYPVAVGKDGAVPGLTYLDTVGADHTTSYVATGRDDDDVVNLGLNSPAYRSWFTVNEGSEDAEPMEDPRVVSRQDLQQGTWLTANVMLGTTDTEVTWTLNGDELGTATRTQSATGEALRRDVQHSDPWATLQQLVNGGSPATGSHHLWRMDLPSDLPLGTHTAEATTTDQAGTTSTARLTFTVEQEPRETASTD